VLRELGRGYGAKGRVGSVGIHSPGVFKHGRFTPIQAAEALMAADAAMFSALTDDAIVNLGHSGSHVHELEGQ
jgi:hypothetical protein